MIDLNTTDEYLLVKDKDGRMKYYKDGQFFSVEEIEQKKKQEKTNQAQVTVKKPLRPIYTLETTRAAAAEQKIAPMPKSEPAKRETPLAKITIPAVPKADMDHEYLAVDGSVRQKREEDQKLVEERVDQVIEKLKIKFSDEGIRARFRNMLLTYFRGIRTGKELGYMLGLPKMSGGLELPKDKVVLIISVLEHEAEELNKNRRQLAIKVKDGMDMRPVAVLEHRLAPPPPALEARPVKNFSSQPISTEKKIPATTVFRPAADMPRPAVKRPGPQDIVARPDSRPRIEDLKHSHRLIGPVEELGTMDLTNFRRLGRNEKEIFEEISEKFHILAEQSLLKKIEGLNAWRRSPVYVLYLSMIMEGIREKKTVQQVIEGRQFKNTPVLSLSEYEMIARLNQTLNT